MTQSTNFSYAAPLNSRGYPSGFQAGSQQQQGGRYQPAAFAVPPPMFAPMAGMPPMNQGQNIVFNPDGSVAITTTQGFGGNTFGASYPTAAAPPPAYNSGLPPPYQEKWVDGNNEKKGDPTCQEKGPGAYHAQPSSNPAVGGFYVQARPNVTYVQSGSASSTDAYGVTRGYSYTTQGPNQVYYH